MELKKRHQCPLCGSENIKHYKNGTFDPEKISGVNFNITDSNYGSRWTFFSCGNCRFVFSNPYIPAGNIIEFYAGLEDREYDSEAEGRAKNFKTILRRLFTLEKPGNSLLDVGAASGIFLDLAGKAGYETTGIEPSMFLVKVAERRYGLKIFKGTIETFPPVRKFAVITLLDILEHLVDADAFLTKIDSLLQKNGILVIVTPDINSIAARAAGKRWWHYRVAHVNFFNMPALEYLLTKHRYEVVLKKRYAWNFSLFYLLTRVFPSLKNKKALQKSLKRVNLKLQLFDSWEIYARKK